MSLIFRMVPVSSQCCVCENGEETVDHALYHCCFSQSVWRELYGTVDNDALGFSIPESWVGFVFYFWKTKRSLESALVTGWAIWNNRNNCLFHQVRKSASSIVI